MKHRGKIGFGFFKFSPKPKFFQCLEGQLLVANANMEVVVLGGAEPKLPQVQLGNSDILQVPPLTQRNLRQHILMKIQESRSEYIINSRNGLL